MSTYRPILSGVIGGVVGLGIGLAISHWLGLFWGLLAYAALALVGYALIELWYRVIWPLDAHKPSLPWNRPKEDA